MSNGRTSFDSVKREASSLASKYLRAVGSASSPCNISLMIIRDVDAKAMVAGVKTGAGNADVVCVRERAERDLSRKSAIAYWCGSAPCLHSTEDNPDVPLNR